MKYEIGDTVKYRNSGYEFEAVVFDALPPQQPTYNVRNVIDGSIRMLIAEDRLVLVRKKPAPCGHIRGRVEKRDWAPLGDKWHEPVDWYIPNDFCPLCGEDLRDRG